MSATGDHQLVEERIPHCQKLVMKGAMHCVKRYFLSQPMERSHNMLTRIAQIVITYHNERAGKPLVDHTCHSDGSVNPSNKFTAFLPGLVQMHQFCEIISSALDFGWTWTLPLPFHGQSSDECVEAVFADSTMLAETYPLKKNPAVYSEEEFKEHKAPRQVQEI